MFGIASKKPGAAPNEDLCGFCSDGGHPEGRHPHCPRAIRNGRHAPNKILICDCTSPGCGGQLLRCFECHTEEQELIDPNNWVCWDKPDCHERVERRLDSSPLVQEIRELRSAAMAKIQADRAVKAARTNEGATAVEGKSRIPREPAKPKVGACLHCGGTTKGGNFLPGHDAAYVSTLVGATVENPKTEEANRKLAYTASDHLGKKFDKSYGLAVERVAKSEKAAQEKADAKATKAAEKAAAPPKADAPKPGPAKALPQNGKGKPGKPLTSVR